VISYDSPLKLLTFTPVVTVLNEKSSLVRDLGRRISRLRYQYGLSMAAKAEMRREQQAETGPEVPIEAYVVESLAWIGRAQDGSRSRDGGVARDYSLIEGWSTSYPETTGYIIPTMLREARALGDTALAGRAQRMLDWLVSIQMASGAFQGGAVGGSPVVPVTFNTGQILLGLAAGVTECGSKYLKAMTAAADWLVATQDADGCWRKHGSPFVERGEKTYDAHAAWGLFEAARVDPSRGYAEAAMRNLNWAISHQNEQGWFANCCLSDPDNPLTHTLGYMLRGMVEAYLFTREKKMLEAALKTAEGALSAMQPNGYLPGRLDSTWRGVVPWSCLTGTEQIAICWFLLFMETGDVRLRDAGRVANAYVRKTVRLDGPLETRGAVKGSFPVSGGYATFQYPNWATKFFVDSQRLENTIGCEEERDIHIPLYSRAACPAD
jgi:Squalene-hopene cyclase C-terminal domain